MAKQINDGNVECPFFLNCGRKTISCEGITDDSKIYLSFTLVTNRNQHLNLFCTKRYKNCEIYNMLEKKYED